MNEPLRPQGATLHSSKMCLFVCLKQLHSFNNPFFLSFSNLFGCASLVTEVTEQLQEKRKPRKRDRYETKGYKKYKVIGKQKDGNWD